MNSEIKFKRDTGFRKQFFVPDSFAHPAKMDAQLLIWIVENYTKEGETILDPMAGSGTTMLACTLGRNCILVELEEKFCKMMRDNWNEVRMRPQLGSSMGSCKIIQGDARQLEGLLVDKCIFSPPYAGAEQFLDKEWINREQPRPHRPQVDKIVTSPPYAESVSADAGGERDQSSARQREKRLRNKGYDPAKYQGGVGRNLEVDFQYSKDPANIGNLPYGLIDKIVTSPPYEEAMGKHHATSKLQQIKKDWGEYSTNRSNIGNLKSDSYLEAMLQVYQQCYSVLKPQGLMILVTKNFIRNKQVVRLDEDTIKLCEQAGFSYLERHYRKLPSQSFWRVIYHQKHPEVEQILNEDVLVFKK